MFAPFVAKHVEGPLHSILGWTGLFGPAQPTGVSMFTASLILGGDDHPDRRVAVA